jgi:hypothetical protein
VRAHETGYKSRCRSYVRAWTFVASSRPNQLQLPCLSPSTQVGEDMIDRASRLVCDKMHDASCLEEYTIICMRIVCTILFSLVYETTQGASKL